jgi:hypothetical protein
MSTTTCIKPHTDLSISQSLNSSVIIDTSPEFSILLLLPPVIQRIYECSITEIAFLIVFLIVSVMLFFVITVSRIFPLQKSV